jgi:hypothetical protein
MSSRRFTRLTDASKEGREPCSSGDYSLYELQLSPHPQDAAGPTAMAAGLTERRREIDDIAKVLEDWENGR